MTEPTGQYDLYVLHEVNALEGRLTVSRYVMTAQAGPSIEVLLEREWQERVEPVLEMEWKGLKAALKRKFLAMNTDPLQQGLYDVALQQHEAEKEQERQRRASE